SDNASDIRGRSLEMGDDFYIQKFGKERVGKIDVLNVVESPHATIIADLTCTDHIPSNSFDCIIFTPILTHNLRYESGIKQLYRILKPKSVLLLASHGISKTGHHLGRNK
ncbi:MAG: methyltransferase, partial [Planctomycetota bacterium]